MNQSRTASDSAIALNPQRLARLPFLRRVAYYPRVESTNTIALELAQAADTLCPALVLAGEQTAGRGRGANRWWSAPGALTFSLLIQCPEELKQAQWPKIALTMAVSLCRSLQVHAPGVSFGIRWPNDVWVQGKKIAGILVEVPASAATTRRLVVGVGVNVNNPLREAPPDLRDGATSLIEVGARAFDLTEVLIALLKRFEIDLDRLVAGSPELPDEWKSLCLLRGSVVTIAQGTRQFRGVAREIDSDGALVLESQGRLTRFFGGVLTSVEKVEQTSAARRGSNGSSPGG